MIRRLLISLAVLGATAAPAAAQNGVVVDPSSPSGKEYAIPLDSARRDAAGGRPPSGGGGSKSAPLFGAGVGDAGTPAPSVSGKAPEPDGDTGQKRSRRSRTAAGGGRDRPSLQRADARPVAAAIPRAGSSSTLTVIAVALSVLLLGGVIGSIARRRG